MKPLAVLRPEPGNAATAARIAAAGGRVIRLPLFAIVPLAWTPPDPADHDALLLTSANAVRQGGPGLGALQMLPVYAVGAATATAARAAGLNVVATGDADAQALAETMALAGVARALHLAGRERTTADLPGVGRTIAVYASDTLPIGADALLPLAGTVALVHSPRAGARLAELLADRDAVAISAISAPALAAAGPGWAATAVAAAPNDGALIAAALTLAD